MLFIRTAEVSDITAIVSIILVIVGGLFAYYQWRKSLSLKRASYINDLTEKIRTDSDIKEIIYNLDYGVLWYNENFHGSGELEAKIDRTLSYFTYICYLKRQRIITKKEFKFFEYEIERILTNNQVQNYFYNLYHFSNKFNIPFLFTYLLEYGKRNRILPKDFYDKEAYKSNGIFTRYLNF